MAAAKLLDEVGDEAAELAEEAVDGLVIFLGKEAHLVGKLGCSDAQVGGGRGCHDCCVYLPIVPQKGGFCEDNRVGW